MIAIKKQKKIQCALNALKPRISPNHAVPSNLVFINEHSNMKYNRLLLEASLLQEKQIPIGTAAILGDIDQSVCLELQNTLRGVANYIGYCNCGPFVMAVFQRDLFEHLLPIWHELLIRAPGVCAGTAFPEHGMSASDSFLAARLALMRAIALHQDMVALDEEEALVEVKNHHLALAMKREIENGGSGFMAHFQPQVQLASGQPIGAEALARWQMNGENIPPAHFISIAEDTGLIGPIGEIMLGRASQALSMLRRSDICVPRIAVNVSPSQMHWNDFLRTALQTVHDNDLSPADIEIEITESTVDKGGENFVQWMKELADAGFPISIDDFGTGRSTLARIHQIPSEKIKLDRAFVTLLPNDPSSCKVCHAALKLTHSLGKTSLAEGVETRSQSKFLKSCGCTQGQGYFWGKPMPVYDFAQWWNRRTPCPSRCS